MKTLTRILLLCLFPVLATGCEKEVITRYERSGRHEYKFINDSSKDVFVIYTSNSNGMVREDGFMIAKGTSHSVYMFVGGYDSPFCLWSGYFSDMDAMFIYNDEVYIEYFSSYPSPYYDAFYDSVYTENHITYLIFISVFNWNKSETKRIYNSYISVFYTIFQNR